jgi:hypothetical protein
MKNAVAQYDEVAYINGIKLKGVSSVDGSYSHQFRPLNILGQGVVKNILGGIPEANFSITRNLGFIDLLDPLSVNSITKFGNHQLRGSLEYGNKVFGFETGFLSSYSYSVSLGNFPTSNVNIKAYGDIGSGLYITSTNENASQQGMPGTLNARGANSDSFDFPIYPANIILNCRGATTNRVTSFSLSFNVPYHEVYAINAITPLQVTPKYPIEVLASFTLEADDYELQRMTNALRTGVSDAFSVDVYGTVYNDIELKGENFEDDILKTVGLLDGENNPLYLYKAGNKTLNLFHFESSASTTRISSEQMSATAEDVATIKIDYITYINREFNNSTSNFDQRFFESTQNKSIKEFFDQNVESS